MINIPIERRRDYLKRIYNALSSSLIGHGYTQEKVKDMAITSEYECCENSKTESEYHMEVMQLIQRVYDSNESRGVVFDAHPQKRQPVIKSPKVFYSNVQDTSGFSDVLDARKMQAPPHRWADTSRFRENKALLHEGKRFLDYSSQFGHQQLPMSASFPSNRRSSSFYSVKHPPCHNFDTYQRRDFSKDPHMRLSNTFRAPSDYNLGLVGHDDSSYNFYNQRTNLSQVCNSCYSPENASCSFEPGYGSRSIFDANTVLSHGSGIFKSSSPMRKEPEHAQGFSSRNLFNDSTYIRQPMFSAYLQDQDRAKTRLDNSGISEEGRKGITSSECTLEKQERHGVGFWLDERNFDKEILNFNLEKMPKEVTMSDREKVVVLKKLDVFKKEFSEIEDIKNQVSKLGSSSDAFKRLEATCKIIGTQIDLLSQERYFIKPMFLDIAIQKARMYALKSKDGISGEESISHGNVEFVSVCKRIRSAFTKAKSTKHGFFLDICCRNPRSYVSKGGSAP